MGKSRRDDDRKERRRHRSRSRSRSPDRRKESKRRDHKESKRHSSRDRHRDDSRRRHKSSRRSDKSSRHTQDQWVEKKAVAADIDKMADAGPKVVTLPNFDDQGRPLNLDQDPRLQHLQGDTSTGSSSRSRRKVLGPVMDDGQDDDIMTLLHQEKYANAGNSDAQMAKRILRDAKFEDNLEYLDDNVDKLAKTSHGLSDQQKRNIAVDDYKTLVDCHYCFQTPEKDSGTNASPVPPSVPVVAIGNQVYLALPESEPMVPGHCLIVPLQHTVSTLRCEDDTWTEIRNFMKCLMYAFHAKDQAVVFMETVMEVSARKGRHTAIECIPIPQQYEGGLAAFFKEGLMDADEEWTQHRRIIDTAPREKKLTDLAREGAFGTGCSAKSDRTVTTGGFRRTMSPQVAYFHVWLTLDGGLGHVIENPALFPRYFGKQILASIVDVPPRLYRHPKKLPSKASLCRQRAREFRELTKWDDFDWTKSLDG
ncbi:Pre-mRNA-splicing factor cwf19 [Tieghemiomyces parasiticus]|uniref:Pre-mRNA-splicing factor cwf19 n=1 Tax=Tieghemiomyces parasiticus TaxID=78921 RepID=A0A9W8E0T5_9FUNG|nr:Pre-mRNA-splicing factor cwf19 [Tieghemiomyces parasiticus]